MSRKFRMLAVDDDPRLRHALQEQFTDEDFEVDTAPDGAVAVASVGRNDYDIVLLDMGMPTMDGMTALREIRKLGKTMPIIMLTGVDDVEKANETVKLGANDFLQKPYDPEELLQ